jgi:hypothetical protein
MKAKEKDPFDYPLRSKKEILFENEINPPQFDVEITKKAYGDTLFNHGSSLNEVDTRQTRVKLMVDMDKMNLTSLQRKRMIFLLGRRYRGDNKLRVSVRQYNNHHHNYARGIDIIKQLYYEAKRAPMFIWEKMYNRERRSFKKKYLGKTKEEQEQNAERYEKMLKVDEAKFEELWKDQDNFTEANMMERYMKKLKSKEDEVVQGEKKEESVEVKGIPTKEEYYKGLVNERVLSPKAYKTFFENNLNQEK